MATIKPFKAIRPVKDKVSLVTSRSYHEYSKRELNAVLEFNPFSFLHIINPGYKYAKNVSGEERFKLVHNRYLEFLEENVFLKDSSDSIYLYQMKKGNRSFTGFFCATSVAEYRNNLIKKHENTIKLREELFASYLDTVKFNAEPVLMTYADDQVIAGLLSSVMQEEPEYLFATSDKIAHRLWKISNKISINKIQKAFEKVDALYIADGHHRSASSNLLALQAEQKNKSYDGKEPYNFFMSYSSSKIKNIHKSISKFQTHILSIYYRYF